MNDTKQLRSFGLIECTTGSATGSTLAIEDHIVALKQKARGRQGLHILGTAFNFVHLPTGKALKVVMVGLRGSLIARWLTGKLNLGEPSFFDESFEGTIDRRNPQTWSVHLRDLEHLLGTQRAISFFDNAPNGPALASITFHVNMVYGIR